MKAQAVSRVRAAIAVALVVASSFATTHAAEFARGHWAGDFSIPAFDDRTHVGAVYQGAYVVAGDFEWAAGVAASHIARWNGTEWEPLGEGLTDRVECLVAIGADLYAGTPYGSSAIQRFDGTSWTGVGELSGYSSTLFGEGSLLYAAGGFSLSGQLLGSRVVMWDGSGWQPLGGEMPGAVRALARYRGDLYAALRQYSPPYSARLMRFDGSDWQDVPGSTTSSYGEILGLAVFGDRLLVGGSFTTIGAVPAPGLAAWDGAAWSGIDRGAGEYSFVSDIVTAGDVLYVAGTSELRAFDGTSWSMPDFQPSGTIRDLATGNGAVLAVGDLLGVSVYYLGDYMGFLPERHLFVHDTEWRLLRPWKPGMRGFIGHPGKAVRALATHKGEVYAAGSFEHAAHPPGWREVRGLARWDGDAWQPVPGTSRGTVTALVSWGDRLVASYYGRSGAYNTMVHAWNGTRWDGLGGELFGNILGLRTWNDGVVAFGSFESAGQSFPLAFTRGSGWELLGAGLLAAGGEVRDAATFRGELYVAGHNLRLPDGTFHPLLRWNGSTWRALPSFTDGGEARALLSRFDGLWFATHNGLMRWDGSTVSQQPSPGWSLDRLFQHLDGLFASGSFWIDGTRTSLARWDGKAWSAVPDAPGTARFMGGILAMTSLGDELFLGGNFNRAGGRHAEGIARWVDQPWTMGRPALMSVSPSPVRTSTLIRFTLAADTRAELSVYDVRGALVARALDEVLPKGTHERMYTFGADARPGVYFARLVTDRGRTVAKIVFAP